MDGMGGGSGEVYGVLMGRYQLLERIGEGGMGVVWRCFDLDLEEPMAIKFLREDYASDDRLRANFRREVRLARRVTHPNVARVYEFGREGDLHFLTMEYVAGESLQATLRREGRLASPRVERLAVSLCRGLAAAHAAGVVHGDIKPGNVLVSPERGAVLTDFGIARALSDTIPREEALGGTLLYMPPEQLLNEAMTPQNDVYALGVLLFEALTGGVPWPASDEAALVAHKLAEPPDLRSLAPGLPDAWCELITDCLRTDPARRPADASALLARLIAMRGKMAGTFAGDVGYPAPPSRATGDGLPWIGVTSRPDSKTRAWLTHDLISTLTRFRRLRVSVAGSFPAAANPLRTPIRGSIQ